MAYRTAASRPGGHPILASLCAGPIFVLVLSLGMLVIPGEGGGPAGAIIFIIIFIMPFALIIGFAVAIVPNVICTSMLRALGERNEATRLPVFWTLVGGLVSGGAAFALAAPPEVAGLFGATGALSALICRCGVDWC